MELTRYSVHRMVLWIMGAGVGRWGGEVRYGTDQVQRT